VSSRIGSDQNFIATTSAGILDDQANSIVSSDTTFGSSPLGIAARTQALYGIANANFNLTPPDPTLPIVDNDNPLPYWTVTNGTEGDGSAIAVFDDSTSTWGVQLSLGTSITDAAISMTTRSFLLNDDNLALRQRALSVVSKSGTAGGTAAQWSLVLSAEYFSATGDSLSSYAIGTVTDVTSWTSISGTTTAGGSAINAAASYVDLTFTMTALGTVTGSAKATIKSLLLQTSTAGAGAQSFLVSETITSSTTWTPPTGVTNLVAVAVAGGGGGGGAGGIRAQVDSASHRGFGGHGGGAGGYSIIRNIPVTSGSGITIGIGAGGAGGTVATFSGTSTTSFFPAIADTGANGAAGGATTFSTLVTASGGGGGTGGYQGTSTTIGTTTIGGSAGTTTCTVYEAINSVPGRGGARGSAGVDGSFAAYSAMPYVSFLTGASGGSVTLVRTASGTAFRQQTAIGTSTLGLGGGGGAGGGMQANAAVNQNFAAETLPTASGRGGGGGGGCGFGISSATGINSGDTFTIICGSGGSAAFASSAGGGGGGGFASAGTVVRSTTGTTVYTFAAGAGGAGAGGAVTLWYIA